mmetsp:Transcript_51902/g.117096  ORF Transcript_51902/g.117096 Transcript_51902/m.117096 type:complete len:235 (+) Transcript_51902:38-742(+)
MVVKRNKQELPLLASLRRVAKEKPPLPLEEQGAETQENVVKQTAKKAKKAGVKKAKKGAPAEVSSRRPVAPKSAAAPRKGEARARDPRFDDLSGKLNVNLFQKSYSFLEDYRQDELSEMKERARKINAEGEDQDGTEEYQEWLQTAIKRRTLEDKQRKHLGAIEETKRSLKRQELEKVRQTGKTPYFHRTSLVKKIVREKKSEGKAGSRDRTEEKREKKVAAKEKKRLPGRRDV